MPKKLTTEQFIERARAVHGDRYDYSYAKYVNQQTKLKIVCPSHGPFQKTPNSHISQKTGCPICSGRSVTTDSFIEKARTVHGDRYDYSLVKYKGSHTYVKIVCPYHGAFEQTPTTHINDKSGCVECAGLKKLSNTKFIARAKTKHGDKYDYKRVQYVNAHTPVVIICPEHGPFSQTPHNHTYGKGKGCPDCAHRNVSTDDFVGRARILHGDRYDYSFVNYSTNRIPVKIICPVHGPFMQSPDNHLAGKGCIDCSGRKPLDRLSFVEKARAVHGEKYDYSQVKYMNHMTPVTIICPKHGPFPQRPNSHLRGTGCWECGGSKPLNTQSFIEKARGTHADRYDYSSVEYVNALTHVLITCPEHGRFPQTPNAHLSGSGCPDCADVGFNPSERAILYYIAITTDDDDVRYKIGITNHSVAKRFAGPDLDRIRIVKTWQYVLGRAAAEREAEIKRQYAGDRYSGPAILNKAGTAEIFTHDILGLDS